MVLVMHRFFRPWGFYEDHFEERGYKLKRLVVQPNSKLSLQYHFKRCEHSVVVSGHGKIILGEDTLNAYPGRYFYIPTKVNHRIMAGEDGLTIIEVQVGDECKEDDIVRLEDDYDRV